MPQGPASAPCPQQNIIFIFAVAVQGLEYRDLNTEKSFEFL